MGKQDWDSSVRAARPSGRDNVWPRGLLSVKGRERGREREKGAAVSFPQLWLLKERQVEKDKSNLAPCPELPQPSSVG